MKHNRPAQSSSRRRAQQQRYGVNTEGPRGIETIGTGVDLDAEFAFAERHHGATGQKTWVWDMHSGLTLGTLERVMSAAGGGAC